MERSIRKYWPIFVLPTLIAFAIGFLIPFFMGIYLSFCDFTTVTDAQFVGFANYVKAFADPSSNFTHALWYTALFSAVNLALVNLVGLLLALLLVKGVRGTNLFRTVFFMPNMIGGIVLGWIWQLLLNGLLAKFGRTLVYSESYGFWGLAALTLWQQAGYVMVIYIAGLQSIPEDLLEAAAMDGASPWQSLTRIRLPLLAPSITICTFLTLSSSFELFDENLALTNGAPSGNSELLALNIFNTFYGRNGWQGAGQAKAVVFFIIVAVVALVQLRISDRQEVR